MGLTISGRFNTFETVPKETPAAAATSLTPAAARVALPGRGRRACRLMTGLATRAPSSGSGIRRARSGAPPGVTRPPGFET
ncbi:hypothetical protein GCM10009744_01170 [Kribbella alba]|uniref:Uncharacterized protein n=1 Tax=Kribbella alba TaxID=190197 RepID=A0ABP4QQ72_9ACTN